MPEDGPEKPAKINTAAFWKHIWGHPDTDYELAKKAETLVPLFQRLNEQGKLGNVVIDFGSGSESVLNFLPRDDERRAITVDITGEFTSAEDALHVAYDLNKAPNRDDPSSRRALLQAAHFLDVDPKSEDVAHADTMIFVEILNYLDYKPVLAELARFLKRGGRVIIMNQVDRGPHPAILHPGRPKSNDEIQLELESLGFQIEIRSEAPPEPGREDKRMMLLVAKKL